MLDLEDPIVCGRKNFGAQAGSTVGPASFICAGMLLFMDLNGCTLGLTWFEEATYAGSLSSELVLKCLGNGVFGQISVSEFDRSPWRDSPPCRGISLKLFPSENVTLRLNWTDLGVAAVFGLLRAVPSLASSSLGSLQSESKFAVVPGSGLVHLFVAFDLFQFASSSRIGEFSARVYEAAYQKGIKIN